MASDMAWPVEWMAPAAGRLFGAWWVTLAVMAPAGGPVVGGDGLGRGAVGIVPGPVQQVLVGARLGRLRVRRVWRAPQQALNLVSSLISWVAAWTGWRVLRNPRMARRRCLPPFRAAGPSGWLATGAIFRWWRNALSRDMPLWWDRPNVALPLARNPVGVLRWSTVAVIISTVVLVALVWVMREVRTNCERLLLIRSMYCPEAVLLLRWALNLLSR